MQQAVPKGKKTSAKGGKRLLSLYSRLILLNMRTDLKRVIVTIVSAAGCCALIVIGFTLKAAVNGAVKNQYSSVVHYDAKVQYEYGEEIEAELIRSGVECVPLYDVYITYRITDNQVGELLCGDISQISSFRLENRRSDRTDRRGHPDPAASGGDRRARHRQRIPDHHGRCENGEGPCGGHL